MNTGTGFLCSGRSWSPARAVLVSLCSLAAVVGVTKVQGQSITGNISTTFGVPIPGVLVTATRASPFQQVTGTTDASGNYTLVTGIHVNGSTYSVVPGKAGYTFTPASTNVGVFLITGNVTVNFTTPATVPSATTQPAQNVTTTSAALQGILNPAGAATTAWFQYGLTTGYGSVSSPNSLGSGNASLQLGTAIGSLLNGTNYHFQLVASNRFGVTLGGDLSFATLSGIPSVYARDSTGGGATTMTLNGLEVPSGANTTGWFEWGTTTSYGNVTAKQDLGGTINTIFSQPLTGLTPNATYHYRAVAASAFGTNFGADVLFTPIFGDIAAGLPGVFYSAVAWGDYDFDGRLDILLTGNLNSNTTAQIWRNTGTGFGNVNAGLPGISSSAVAWGDFDNNGWLDILLTGTTNVNSGTGPIAQAWRNTGSGFVNLNAGLPGVFYSSVAWGDYDNDGRLDILLTGISDSGVIAQVWRNSGNGFVNVNAGLPGVSYGSVAWGDYDNDGWLDILLTGHDGSRLIAQIWRNTGNGFSNINAGLPGVYYSSAAWGGLRQRWTAGHPADGLRCFGTNCPSVAEYGQRVLEHQRRIDGRLARVGCLG